MAISDEFTHFNEEGRGRMVDVTHKKDTARMALARGAIYMKPQTLEKILSNQMKKGDYGVQAHLGADPHVP